MLTARLPRAAHTITTSARLPRAPITRFQKDSDGETRSSAAGGSRTHNPARAPGSEPGVYSISTTAAARGSGGQGNTPAPRTRLGTTNYG